REVPEDATGRVRRVHHADESLRPASAAQAHGADDRSERMRTLGPLTAADEMMTHQIVDTFATVGQTDRSWTEKVCAMACAKDGSLYLGFGLGKYTNRGVMDGYAAVSRGAEMRIVRGSRELGADPVTT